MLEKDIKIKLINYLIDKKLHEIVVPEVTVGHKSISNKPVRADLFAINGDISIYEIKSERDSLQRLSNQLENYKKYANKVNIVIAEKFLDKIEIDMSIGIYVIENGKIKKIRSAQSATIDTDNILEYWLSNELKDFLKGYKGISKLGKNDLLLYLKSLLNNTQIYQATLLMLKNRYLKESDFLKTKLIDSSLTDFPKRGLSINNNTIPLKKIPFGQLMP